MKTKYNGSGNDAISRQKLSFIQRNGNFMTLFVEQMAHSFDSYHLMVNNNCKLIHTLCLNLNNWRLIEINFINLDKNMLF